MGNKCYIYVDGVRCQNDSIPNDLVCQKHLVDSCDKLSLQPKLFYPLCGFCRAEGKITRPDTDMHDKICERHSSHVKIFLKGGMKHDSDKTDYTLVPVEAITAIAQVMMYGMKKYERNNYKLVEDPGQRYFAATLRHLYAFMEGENIDIESGLPHMHMAITNMAFLIWFDSNGFDIGDWR